MKFPSRITSCPQNFRLSAALLVFGLIASGCAHIPQNAPLISSNPSTGYRFRQTASTTNSDLLLMLAVSGGGTRAASLSYGVLEDRLRQLAARQLADNVEFRRLVSDFRNQPIKPDSPARPALAVAKAATQIAIP